MNNNYVMPDESTLTKEQIESEGWVYTPVDNYFRKSRYKMKFSTTISSKALSFLHIVDERLTKDDMNFPQYFAGTCNDINTFRFIYKLINYGRD